MNIRIWIEDANGKVIKELGTCVTDSPSRALQMYQDELEEATADGTDADLHYQQIDD